jgi:hypothetical protein
MGQDEAGTLARIKSLRSEVIELHVAEHGSGHHGDLEGGRGTLAMVGSNPRRYRGRARLPARALAFGPPVTTPRNDFSTNDATAIKQMDEQTIRLIAKS